MKELALKASQKQFDEVIAKFKIEANKGSFECEVTSLTDGTIHLLQQANYYVRQQNYKGTPTDTYTVSLAKN